VTYSSASAKYQLPPWIRHLALAASGAAQRSWLVAKDGVFSFEPVGPDDARAHLVALVALYRRGLREPLAFAPKTSMAWLVGLDASPDKARKDAAKAWDLSDFGFPEGDDPHCLRVWRERAPYDHPD